jgi:hypothetical protein
VRSRARFVGLLVAAWFVFGAGSAVPQARAQSQPPPARDARFEWDAPRRLLYVTVSYRDVVDGEIRRKLSRGLPTTIVLTGTIHRSGATQPLSTTAQTCKITWHVWEEAYRIEIVRPGSSVARWTTTVEGVLRRCAEAQRLLAGDRQQIPQSTAVYLTGKVQINPISAEVLQKIKRWVSRPTGTGTAAPGDALFSTFTGLFLQRIGQAERELKFSTKLVMPDVPKPKEK